MDVSHDLIYKPLMSQSVFRGLNSVSLKSHAVYTNKLYLNFIKFLKNNLEDISHFCGVTDTSPQGFKAIVGSLICLWWRCVSYMFLEILLYRDTCWPLGSQHGNQAILIYVPGSRYWWGSNPRHIMLSLSVKLGRHSTDWAMPTRLI